MKKRLYIVIILVISCLLTSCVPGDGSNSIENPAGFLLGLWHGIIVIISFIGS